MRTDADAVKALLLPGKDYDLDNAPSLDPFMETATSIVDEISGLGAVRLELIERWLSAHFYCMSDQTLAAKTTDISKGAFHGKTGMNLDATKYGQTAKMLDTSGTLASLSERKVASMFWAGRPVSEQTPYYLRD